MLNDQYLTKEEKTNIDKIIYAITTEFWLGPVSKDAGPLIKNQKSNVIMSCLGHNLSKEKKEKYDPDGKKRRNMIDWIYSPKKTAKLQPEGFKIDLGKLDTIVFSRI